MTTMTDDTKRVLELLAQGKITVEEADQLLRAVKETPVDPPTSRPVPRWMHISIDKTAIGDRPARNVSIRVPLSLARSGLRFGAMFPRLAGPKLQDELRKQGLDLDFSKIDLSQVETLLNDLGETTIDVDGGKAQVRILRLLGVLVMLQVILAIALDPAAAEVFPHPEIDLRVDVQRAVRGVVLEDAQAELPRADDHHRDRDGDREKEAHQRRETDHRPAMGDESQALPRRARRERGPFLGGEEVLRIDAGGDGHGVF